LNDETQLISFFDCDSDSSLHSFTKPLDKIKLKLAEFGLTQNECKVFIFLGKYGPKTGGDVHKALNIPRTETYKLLNHLQSKGILTASFDHPIKYSALPVDNAIETLVKLELQHVKALHMQKNEIIDLWNCLPLIHNQDTTSCEKFQILKGSYSVMNNVNGFITNAKEKLQIFGPEKFFMRLYHLDSLDVLENSAAKIEILTSCTENSMFVFDKIHHAKIRKISPQIQNNLCFVVKDDTELITFLKNDVLIPHEMMAIRTDSLAMIYTMSLLFNQIWARSQFLHPDNTKPDLVDNLLNETICSR
jgi:sugar-specific transcriptional regulator TrmB